MIPYSTQDISDEDARAVLRVLRSKFLTQGPEVARFERALAKKAGAKYAVAFSSGTAALHGAYLAVGVGEGDEVVVPAMTFAATANAARYLGARPVFADVHEADGNIDSADAAKKITKKTKALVAVDYGGRPADLALCRALAKKHRLVFIEDAAQALGASYRGRSVGSLADMTCFSFHPVKSITTGEGGAVTTNDRGRYEKLLLFRTHGITKDPRAFAEEGEGGWHQEMHFLGYNYRLTDIQAALGTSQLKRLASFTAKRRALAKRYRMLLKNIPNLALPPEEAPGIKSAWHLYPVRVDASKRKMVYEELRKAGIGAQVHYRPVYAHPYYRLLGYKKGQCQNAEAFYAGELSLPLYPKLSERQQRFVARTLKRILEA